MLGSYKIAFRRDPFDEWVSLTLSRGKRLLLALVISYEPWQRKGKPEAIFHMGRTARGSFGVSFLGLFVLWRDRA